MIYTSKEEMMGQLQQRREYILYAMQRLYGIQDKRNIILTYLLYFIGFKREYIVQAIDLPAHYSITYIRSTFLKMGQDAQSMRDAIFINDIATQYEKLLRDFEGFFISMPNHKRNLLCATMLIQMRYPAGFVFEYLSELGLLNNYRCMPSHIGIRDYADKAIWDAFSAYIEDIEWCKR